MLDKWTLNEEGHGYCVPKSISKDRKQRKTKRFCDGRVCFASCACASQFYICASFLQKT